MERRKGSGGRLGGTAGLVGALAETFRGPHTWWRVAFISDWVLGVVFFVVMGCIEKFAYPAVIYLPNVTDQTVVDPTNAAKFNYPVGFPHLSTERVPYWAVCVLAVSLILTVCVIFGILVFRSAHEIHHTLLAWWVGFTVTLLITSGAKFYAGRHRPDFMSRCEVDANGDCTGASSIVRDGRMSFPSGHSATAFFSMTLLSLYCSGKLRVFAPERPVLDQGAYEKMISKLDKYCGRFVKWAIASCPFMISCSYIALSRTRDYRHNFSDVLAGSIVGAAVGGFAYCLYFNPLSSVDSHLPRGPYKLDEDEMKSNATQSAVGV